MSFRVQQKNTARTSHDKECQCGDARVAHYTVDGSCVNNACRCRGFKAKGRPEYQSKRARCEFGHAHDSGLEIKECFDLTLLKRAGQIKDFTFHPVIPLVGPSGAVIAKYECDFVVTHSDGTTEWVETKGSHLVHDMGWRLKWALLQDMHKGDRKHMFRVRLG